jgi:Raf kinase inhibitor-like YbhB/YbcL family protein
MHPAETTIEYKPLLITSRAFRAGETIPSKYTGEGEDINPPLDIGPIPEKAKSLTLIVDDPDAAKKTWVHWLVWNIPITHKIKENTMPGEQGWNDFRRNSYGGPYPPSGTHRYFFKIYALDCLLKLPSHTTKQELEQAMSEHILAYGELMGVYALQRKGK